MPIAVIAPDPGSGSGTGGECNPTLIEALEAELAASTAAATALQTQILDWDGNIAFREAKIAEMRAQLDGLSGKKREQLEAKIAKWESLITSTSAKVTEAEAELAAVNATITDIQTAIAAEQAICDGTVTDTEAGTFYLHADHLGRPQFATDSDGAIVWDMGEGVTPFGQGVNLAGAFAQRLMFPGQYADAETGGEITLSHNWHRTYDPTLGRYLQSDPIGLVGGLNRYAYVGGNPTSWFDSNGLCPCATAQDIVAEALSHVGSLDWQYGKAKDNFPAGTNKCNKFVEDVLEASGSNVPKTKTWMFGNEYAPVAGDWGDPNVHIPGYPVVKHPRPGDIAAIKQRFRDATGHVGIVTSRNTTASQSSKTDQVVNNRWGFNPGENPVFRRCSCGTPVDKPYPKPLLNNKRHY